MAGAEAHDEVGPARHGLSDPIEHRPGNLRPPWAGERLYDYIGCAGAGGVAEHQLKSVGNAALSWVGLRGQRVPLDFESAQPIHRVPEQHRVLNAHPT